MVASRSGRWMAPAVLGVVALALACAHEPTAVPAAAQQSAMEQRLTDVQVESGEDGSVVTLLGLRDPVYWAFLHSDPAALVLDIDAVEIATENDLVMVYDGLVENVTVSSYQGVGGESLARVEISLSRDVTYDLVMTPEGLQTVLSPAVIEMPEVVVGATTQRSSCPTYQLQ